MIEHCKFLLLKSYLRKTMHSCSHLFIIIMIANQSLSANCCPWVISSENCMVCPIWSMSGWNQLALVTNEKQFVVPKLTTDAPLVAEILLMMSWDTVDLNRTCRGLSVGDISYRRSVYRSKYRKKIIWHFGDFFPSKSKRGESWYFNNSTRNGQTMAYFIIITIYLHMKANKDTIRCVYSLLASV